LAKVYGESNGAHLPVEEAVSNDELYAQLELC
jgi:hypothetical protein